MATDDPSAALWARFRFAIIGPLLAAPPAHGELGPKLRELAAKTYQHPVSGEPYSVSVQTIERWLYEARATDDPIGVLRRKVRNDAGRFPSMKAPLIAALDKQYRQHPTWSYQLHTDNLRALARADEALGRVPSYPTVRRFMKSRGWIKRRRRGDAAIEHSEREVRSFESAFVGGLWHADFHHGHRKVLLPSGAYVTPKLLAVLDDRSRLCCHAQWYLSETAEVFVHGVTQSLLKRGLPRALLTDNGSAMGAAETTQGLERLSIAHETTLPYSPHQNGKQEAFFRPVEGRLVKMLEGVAVLDLRTLNEATQAWVELEHNREPHDELPDGQSPLDRYLAGPDVHRPRRDAEALADAFRQQVRRKQRRSDGTITVFGVRFELPARYRHMERVTVRVASWDMSSALLVDAQRDVVLCAIYPLDKEQNASGVRRAVTPVDDGPLEEPSGMAPLLRELMTEYAATGLPAGYIAFDETDAPDPGDADA
jgi:putative transposase